MNLKLKKTMAIIGLVFMGLFLISMFVYFLNTDIFGGMLWLFSVLCLGVTLLMFAAIYFTRSFPSQIAKQEELKKLEEAYYKKLEEQKNAEKETANKESESISSDNDSISFGEESSKTQDKL